MAVVYNTAVKNDRMLVVRNAIDAGAGAGKLQIGTVGFTTVLVELALADPSGAVTNGVLALTPPALSATAIASGTASEARLTTSADVVVASGLTVGTTGADVLLNSVVVAVDKNVEITSASLTHG